MRTVGLDRLEMASGYDALPYLLMFYTFFLENVQHGWKLHKPIQITLNVYARLGAISWNIDHPIKVAVLTDGYADRIY